MNSEISAELEILEYQLEISERRLRILEKAGKVYKRELKETLQRIQVLQNYKSSLKEQSSVY